MKRNEKWSKSKERLTKKKVDSKLTESDLKKVSLSMNLNTARFDQMQRFFRSPLNGNGLSWIGEILRVGRALFCVSKA